MQEYWTPYGNIYSSKATSGATTVSVSKSTRKVRGCKHDKTKDKRWLPRDDASYTNSLTMVTEPERRTTERAAKT